MGSLAVVTVTVVMLMFGALCGALSLAILHRSSVPRTTAFAWGAALGPIGLVVAGLIASRNEASAPDRPTFGDANPDGWF